jgi:hypothetical protein
MEESEVRKHDDTSMWFSLNDTAKSVHQSSSNDHATLKQATDYCCNSVKHLFSIEMPWKENKTEI